MVLWPEALPRLREIMDHWTRRVDRMEQLATDGRVDWQVFPTTHAYHEGLRDGTMEALELLETERVMPMPLDLAIIELVRSGLPIEEIAGQCGCGVREVAEILARLARGQDTEPS